MEERLGSILERVLDRLGMKRRLKEATVLTVWGQEVGPKLARMTRALQVEQGVLIVSVRNSVWANELGFFKRELIKRVNARIGEGTIKDIRFVVGVPPGMLRAEVAPEETETEEATLGEYVSTSRRQEKQEPRAAAFQLDEATIADPRLRTALEGLVRTLGVGKK